MSDSPLVMPRFSLACWLRHLDLRGRSHARHPPNFASAETPEGLHRAHWSDSPGGTCSHGSWPGELQPLALGFNNMLGRLEDSFTRLSQFSADLAHELRTPISILRGEAEGALTKPQTLEQYREVIASSLEEMQRLSTMIDNLLFLARAETVGSIKRQFFDGRAALKEICEFYEVLSQEQDVELSCEGRGRFMP